MSDGISDMAREIEYLEENIYDIVWDGIDHKDCPDFCDAHITSAIIDDRPLDWNELDILNNERDFIHDRLMLHLELDEDEPFDEDDLFEEDGYLD
jgi:hypothetical protein